MQSGKQKKEAAKAAEAYVTSFEEAITESLSQGDTESVVSLMNQMVGGKDEMSKKTRQISSFNKKYEELFRTLESEVAPALDRYDDNMGRLAQATGMTTAQIEQAANEMGINLTEEIKNFPGLASAIAGGAGWAPGQIIPGMNAVGVGAALDTFTKPQITQQAAEAVDQTGKEIKDILGGGGAVGQDLIGKYLQDAMTLEMSKGLNFMDAFSEMYKKVGIAGEGMYQDGFQFEGQEAALRDPLVNMMNEAFRAFMNDPANPLGSSFTSLNAQTMEQSGVSINPKKEALSLENQFIAASTTGDVEKMANISKMLSDIALWAEDARWNAKASGFKDPAMNAAANYEGYGMQPKVPEHILRPDDISAVFADPSISAALTGVYTAGWRAPEVVNQVAVTNSAGINRGMLGADWNIMGSMVSAQVGAGIQNAIYTYVPGVTGGDTSTPRGGIGDTASNLAQTMGRHRGIDSSISGKRKITSSYRDWGLGSINSDHVTGRAYDLTGQNLGMYKTIVESDGGFAEYHGGAMNRHLHVVPGEGGVGDSMMPKPNMTSPSGGGFTLQEGPTVIQIHGGRDSAEQIAQQVAAVLDKRDRNRSERMNKANA
jgi:hypothetical protein